MHRLKRYFALVLYMRDMVIGKRLHGNVFKVIVQNLLFREVTHVILLDFPTDTDALTQKKLYFRYITWLRCLFDSGNCHLLFEEISFAHCQEEKALILIEHY